MIWTTTTPQSFRALGFLKASIKIWKTLSFLTSWIKQAVVNPVKFLRAPLNFSIKNLLLKSSLKMNRCYMIRTTTPQSFKALRF